jgi:hypothetical protein
MHKTSPWNLEVELDGVEIVREMPVSIKAILVTILILVLKQRRAKVRRCFKKLLVLKSWLMVRYKLEKSKQQFVNGKPFMDGDTNGSKYPSDAMNKEDQSVNNERAQNIMMILLNNQTQKKEKVLVTLVLV